MNRSAPSHRVRLFWLVAALFAVVGCTGTASPDHPPGSTAATPPTRGVSPTSGPPATDDGAGDAVPAAPPAQARTAAEGFARAWTRPYLDQITWLAGVVPYASPSYTRLLATVDPSNVPGNEITGPLTDVRSTTGVAVFDAPTDQGILRITCNPQQGRWVVTHTAWTRHRR